MSQPRQSTSRLLILEDEKPLLELLTTMLELRGWKCVKAGAAANMAAGFGKSRVDAALLDVNAGETNGLAVAERLRQANPDLPVVMMTGYADEGVRRRVSDLGHLVLIEKPFSLASLEEALAAAAVA